ncbi:MAG: alpha-galactosidase [Fimbriimonadales bacterium]
MLSILAASSMAVSPQLSLYSPRPVLGDWLLNPIPFKAAIYRTENKHEIVLSNGLVSRTFRVSPPLKEGFGVDGRTSETVNSKPNPGAGNPDPSRASHTKFVVPDTPPQPSPQGEGAGYAATIGLTDLTTGDSLLRAIRPEATVRVDGREIRVGGLEGQPDLAYLTRDWIDKMKPPEGGLAFTGYEIGKPAAPVPWKKVRHVPDVPYPPKGTALTLHFSSSELAADVHYELYDGIPLMAKWISITNRSAKAVRINAFTNEILSLVEAESTVDPSESWRRPLVSVFTGYSFGGSTKGVCWVEEPDYKTQVNYELKTPCRLETRPPLGPDIDLAPGKTLDSFRTYELFHNSYDRERQGLAVRRMYRTIAPWTQENPIMLHLTSTDPATVRRAIDQAADCGFEMIVISFWSGLDMENVSPENIAKIKEFHDYAKSKGVELGGYSLLASRHIDKENDVVSPKPIFGASPCLGSKWGIDYFEKMKKFITETGFDLLEHDGSYPGDTCASTTHPGHHGYEDSQWTQFQTISDFYKWCRSRGVFLNVPDVYFLSGSNKTGMGYRETNWSLPREQQHIHARQNLYDGTWEKTPSMGWMMVPLVEYQGGGPAATIEPLHEHLVDYGLHLANNFGYGAQACYRGPRLYDAPETRAVVKKWVDWFKVHRELLESDVIHVRRADGVNLDAVLHVNPAKREAMAVVYNPGDTELEQDIVLPLYYSGLHGSCQMFREEGRASLVTLDGKQRLLLKVKVGPKGCTWFTFR